MLPQQSALKITWLSDDDKKKLETLITSHVTPAPPVGSPGLPGEASKGGGVPGASEVQLGEAGIAGLAQALGSGEIEKKGDRPKDPEAEGQRKRKNVEEKTGPKRLQLMEVLKKRKEEDTSGNVLRLGREAGSAEKRKKKKKKVKKGDKKEGTSSDSDDDGSSSSSLFRFAALPKGVDRLHRLHEERPGAIANVTLRRFNVLLNQSVGRGAAEVTEDLPPVARAYLSQIFLAKHPEGTIGMRNLRELRTLTTALDLIASNHLLQAMDILTQRIKSVELFVTQGHWGQGSLLELIALEGEQRAYSREEMKAAQQEQKTELQLQRGQWQRPWWSREYRQPPNLTGEKGEGGEKDDRAPANLGGARKERREKAKGRKERESGRGDCCGEMHQNGEIGASNGCRFNSRETQGKIDDAYASSALG